jgi:hypothetical protein
MKIIITERQYNLLSESKNNLKHFLFKYWDMKGPDTSNTTMQLFSVGFDERPIIQNWLIEWYGGINKVLKMLNQFEGTTYKGLGGSYDFHFKVSDFRRSSDLDMDEINNFWFDAEVDGNGEVYIEQDNGSIIDNIYDAHNNEDIGWEVDEEIKEIIDEEISKHVFKKTGIVVLCDYMSVTEKGMFKS